MTHILEINNGTITESKVNELIEENTNTEIVKKKTMSKISELLNIYRTAPVAITYTIANIGTGIYYLNGGELLASSGRFLLAGLIAPTTTRQFKLRKRLENIIKKKGYHQKDFETTLYFRCDRQTAYTLLKEYGYENEFKELVKLPKKQKTKRLPHF